MDPYEILSPLSFKHPVRLYDITFKTPLHYLYYFVYARTKKMKQKVLAAENAEELLTYNYQLKDFACDQDSVNRYVYTLICYMYCIYPDFRECLKNASKIYFQIPNDGYFSNPDNKYHKALCTFYNNLLSCEQQK